MSAIFSLALYVLTTLFGVVSEHAERLNSVEIEPRPLSGHLDIPSIGLNLPIIDTQWGSASDIRNAIDSCTGATIIWNTASGQEDGILILAGHRTSCGDNGFGGVETLVSGNRVNVDNVPLVVVGADYGYYGQDIYQAIKTWPPDVVIALQTSLPGSRVIWILLAVP